MIRTKIETVNRKLSGFGIELRLGAGGDYAFLFNDTKARFEDLTNLTIDAMTVEQIVELGKQTKADW